MILGCWGCGNFSELEALFNQVLSKASNKKGLQKVSYENNGCFGILAGCNFTNSSSINREEVLISAAGIPELPDAVVKFVDKRLILSRDCFGRVPLYWYRQQQVIWFASRLQLLLPVLDSPQVSIPGFYGYNCFSYVPVPLSPVEDIFTVPAGCEIVWEINQNQIQNQVNNYKIKNQYEWKEAKNLIRDEKILENITQEMVKTIVFHSETIMRKLTSKLIQSE